MRAAWGLAWPIRAINSFVLAPVVLAGTQASSARDALRSAIPPDPSGELAEARRATREVELLCRHLEEGTGPYEATEAGRAASDLDRARHGQQWALHRAENASWRERRHHRREARAWAEREAEAIALWERHGVPEVKRLEADLSRRQERVEVLEAAQGRQEACWEAHPEVAGQADCLGKIVMATDATTRVYRHRLDGSVLGLGDEWPYRRGISAVDDRLMPRTVGIGASGDTAIVTEGLLVPRSCARVARGAADIIRTPNTWWSPWAAVARWQLAIAPAQMTSALVVSDGRCRPSEVARL